MSWESIRAEVCENNTPPRRECQKVNFADTSSNRGQVCKERSRSREMESRPRWLWWCRSASDLYAERIPYFW